jgi:CubicO group peptidase (beta-lactamase class C family)
MQTAPRCPLRWSVLALTGLVISCDYSSLLQPSSGHQPALATPSFATTLSTYFPPSEAKGGWRKTTSSDKISSLGMNASKLAEFGAYNMSLPYENYYTGVTGYNARNKASLVIKNGWIVGEYYNRSEAKTAVYYLASNGKTFAMMLLGRLILDYPALSIDLNSHLYDPRWLPEGFPLTDPRKADITFDQLLRHVSGIVPEVQAPIATGAAPGGTNWDFAPFTIGMDTDYAVSAPLYFNPGDPSTYTKGSPYSSVGFNHLSLVFRNVTGLEPSLYLRQAMLDPIGVGQMAYKLPTGMGSYVWATGGNGLASARDYARLAYLLLHEGNWAGKTIFPAPWIRQFTTVAGYPNISSNTDCLFGAQYPKDLYRIVGSGVNIAFMVPSLDLVATLNGRTVTSMRDEVSRNFLQNLFAAVTQEYVTCDGRTVNGAGNPQQVVSLTLMDADSDQPLLTMTAGMTITMADLPTRNLNVRAETSPSLVGSVRFALDGNSTYRTETAAPYALAGDDSGDYRPWTPTAGSHTITATPYTGSGATGTRGTPLTISFTVQ